jgi:hypothetical protein
MSESGRNTPQLLAERLRHIAARWLDYTPRLSDAELFLQAADALSVQSETGLPGHLANPDGSFPNDKLSPTPRTDELLRVINEGRRYDYEGPEADLCRQLERELATFKELYAREAHAKMVLQEQQSATTPILRIQGQTILQWAERCEITERRAELAEEVCGHFREALLRIRDATHTNAVTLRGMADLALSPEGTPIK